jgi:DNA-binding NarL/FixJ family response regulator
MLPEEVIFAIKAAYSGRIVVTPASVLLSPQNGQYKRTPPDWYKMLTDKELDVLRLIVNGYENTEIAEELFLGKQTVRNYVSSIYDKSNIHGRVHLMRVCIDLKLFDIQ